MPNEIIVEVPAMINKGGVNGIKLKNYPSDFSSLLLNQTSVIKLTAEAILEKSKNKALKALLADPIVDNAIQAKKMLDHMIKIQEKHLGYLQKKKFIKKFINIL